MENCKKFHDGSPDITDPIIEGIFHIVKDMLEEESIERNNTKESFEEFQTWVLRTIGDLDTAVVDKAIRPGEWGQLLKGKARLPNIKFVLYSISKHSQIY